MGTKTKNIDIDRKKQNEHNVKFYFKNVVTGNAQNFERLYHNKKLR